jgi:hypothetical protein
VCICILYATIALFIRGKPSHGASLPFMSFPDKLHRSVFGFAAKSVLGFISKGWHLVTQEKILTLEGKLCLWRQENATQLGELNLISLDGEVLAWARPI